MINIYVYSLCVINYPVLIELEVDATVEAERFAEEIALKIEDQVETREVGVRHQEIEMQEVSVG